MLKPPMNELMKRVGNRYLLVNLTAQRARDIAQDAEVSDEPLHDKPVRLALDEIAAGTIVHRPGKRPEPPAIPTMQEMLEFDLSFDAPILSGEPKDEQGDE